MAQKKQRTYYSVDCEVDGPAAPYLGSLFWFGAVRVDQDLKTTFSGQLAPVSDYYEDERLLISGLTRADTLLFPKPEIVMPQFAKWVLETCNGNQPELVSDNNGFDFGLMNHYLWQYAHGNPFGHTSRNINDLYKGLEGNIRSSFKHLVQTPHTHNPVDDAVGHAEAFLAIAPRLKIKI
jgi:Exonuclease